MVSASGRGKRGAQTIVGAGAPGSVGECFLLGLRKPGVPFKLNQDRRHHILKQTHKVMNPLGALLRSWPAYEAGLRQRGSLTVWFTDEAIEAWAAEPRTTRGRQACTRPWRS